MGQSLMDTFSNPETIGQLSFGDKMLGSTITMLMGMGITFLVLILIWIFISLMGKALGNGKKKEPVGAAPAAAVKPAAQVQQTGDIDESVVAVIAAAIAAYEGGSADDLVVTKITRLTGTQTPWMTSAMNERIETRKFY